jgi:hypothetical protein
MTDIFYIAAGFNFALDHPSGIECLGRSKKDIHRAKV